MDSSGRAKGPAEVPEATVASATFPFGSSRRTGCGDAGSTATTGGWPSRTISGRPHPPGNRARADGAPTNPVATQPPGAHTTAPGEGAVIAVAVPSTVPPKVAHLQANDRRDSDSRPLGAGMGSSAFFLPLARSTATTGAWPFAHHHGVGMPGIHTGDDGPFGAPAKTAARVASCGGASGSMQPDHGPSPRPPSNGWSLRHRDGALCLHDVAAPVRLFVRLSGAPRSRVRSVLDPVHDRLRPRA